MPPRYEFPPNAKRVFKGVIFEVWQWEQKMYDGSTMIFEKLKRPDTASVIPIVGEKILVLTQEQPHHSHPFSSLPGGRLDEGENPLAAAKRELLEETGYISSDWLLWKEQHPVSKMVWTVYTYIARNCVLKQEPHLDAGERITTRFFSFDEFLMLSEDPTFYEGELSQMLLRARFDQKTREEFKKVLFGNV